MLDLSQFEYESNTPIKDKHTLIAECRRLQENNRELCEFLKEPVRDCITSCMDDALSNKHWRNWEALHKAYEADLLKLDALIAKNTGA